MYDSLQRLGFVPFFTGQLSLEELEGNRTARVIEVQRSRLVVTDGDKERSVTLPPALQQAAAIDRPTVGDWVVLDASLASVDRVLERKSLFRRVAAGIKTEVQPIAANIDTVFVVTSCNEEFKESRLERYLALCAEAGVNPVVVLTKIDLADDAEPYVDRARSVQANLAVEAVNALEPAGLAGIRTWIDKGSTVALVGSSGVGKTTLLNALAGETVAATGGIREQDKKGRHTTTHRALYQLPGGGQLIDVPGMRELRVTGIEDSLATVFEDVEALASRCRFADCSHQSEPGCAVRRAIDSGEMDERRLLNYQKLQRENFHANATLAEQRAKQRDFAKLVKQVKALKQQKAR